MGALSVKFSRLAISKHGQSLTNVIIIVIICLLITAGVGTTAISVPPVAASPEAVKWTRVNIPAEGEAGFLSKADQNFKNAGVKVIKFPKTDQQKYESTAVIPVINAWIKDKESKGLEGRKVWETLREAALKYEKMPH